MLQSHKHKLNSRNERTFQTFSLNPLTGLTVTADCCGCVLCAHSIFSSGDVYCAQRAVPFCLRKHYDCLKANSHVRKHLML